MRKKDKKPVMLFESAGSFEETNYLIQKRTEEGYLLKQISHDKDDFFQEISLLWISKSEKEKELRRLKERINALEEALFMQEMKRARGK